MWKNRVQEFSASELEAVSSLVVSFKDRVLDHDSYKTQLEPFELTLSKIVSLKLVEGLEIDVAVEEDQSKSSFDVFLEAIKSGVEIANVVDLFS